MTVSPASSLHYDMTPRVSYRQFAPLVRIRTIQHRRRAVAMSLLVHGLALSLIASLPDRGSAPVAPSEPTVALMFAPPSAQIEPAPAASTPPTPQPPTPKADVEPPPPSHAQPKATPEPDLQQDVESPKLPAPIMPPRAAASHPVVHPSQLPARATPSAQPPAANEITAAATALTPARPVAGMETDRPPAYPEIARRRGEQGRVLLRVAVSPAGLPVNVSVAESSGYSVLDTAAVNAVEQWRFVPATRAGAPVAATAEVPLRFRLVD
ncbi:MAG TPA: energy transducer TonB [Acetobacteraceae bacterium]